jgi:hypothetical protein
MSSNNPFPDHTPNVTIENPKVRKTVRTVIDIIGAATFVAAAIDVASPEIVLTAVTVPVGAGYLALRSVFGFAVDNRNTPKF